MPDLLVPPQPVVVPRPGPSRALQRALCVLLAVGGLVAGAGLALVPWLALPSGTVSPPAAGAPPLASDGGTPAAPDRPRALPAAHATTKAAS